MTPYSSFPIGYTVQLVRNRVVEEDRKIYQDILGQCDCDCSSDCACSTDQCSQSDLAFINHDKVLRIIIGKSKRLIVLYGPIGYGKTRLLKRVMELTEKDWLCVLVNLWDNGKKKVKSKEQVFREICVGLDISENIDTEAEDWHWLIDKIQNKPPFILMFDTVERADPETVIWLRKLVHYLVREPNRQDKFVFSMQRFEEDEWQGYNKQPLKAIGIEDLKICLSENNSNLNDDVVDRIIWLSCGHPGTFAALVKYWRATGLRYLFDPTDDQFVPRVEGILSPFIRELKEDLEDDNFDLLRKICIYYLMDQNALKALEERNLLICYQETWGRLLKWGVFVKRDGIYTDGVIRPLVARWLEFKEPDKYYKYHQIGLNIWIEQFDKMIPLAQDGGVGNSAAVQVMRAIIYHALCRAACGYQKLRTQEKEDRKKEYLTCIVNTLIKFSADCDQAMNFYCSAADFSAEEFLALEVKLKLQWLDVDGRDVENAFLRISKQRSGHDAPKGDDQMNGIDAIFEAVADAITMLKHNAQNVLRERWEKRNKGKATTPPIFEDQPMSDGKPISEEQVIEQTTQDVRKRVMQGLPTHFSNPDGESIEISDKHIGSLKIQIVEAQRSIDRYNEKLAQPQDVTSQVNLESAREKHEEKKRKAEQELADIIAYLLDPNS